MDSATASNAQTRRSRLDIGLTATSVLESSNFSLATMMQYLKGTSIPGPIKTRDCHLGSIQLGEGAQFEVFGMRAQIGKNFPDFDRPFLPNPKDWFQLEAEQHQRGSTTPFLYEYEKRTVELVAIKRAKLPAATMTQPLGLNSSSEKEGTTHSQLRDTILEILALSHSSLRRHPNIVKLLAWGYDSRGYFWPYSGVQQESQEFSPILFVEYGTMSLKAFCKDIQPHWGLKQHLCHGVAAGLEALHECGIMHGDIKPDNVLIFISSREATFPCAAKLSDFGCSVSDLASDSENNVFPRGTEGWSAPEQQQGVVSSQNAFRCDIWSCALTIWSTMTLSGEVPRFSPKDVGGISHLVKQDFLNNTRSETSINKISTAVGNMLQIDEELRSQNLAEVKEALAANSWQDPESERTRFAHRI
jgi:serine/threonine protein kinase